MPFSYTINLDTWNNLPKDVQEQLLDAGRAASLRFSDLYDKEWERVIAAQKELGYTVTIATAADEEKWAT
ncbi:unnamed protein product, partial [marine sediment metagenome]